MSKTGFAERRLNQQICPRLQFFLPAQVIVSIAFLLKAGFWFAFAVSQETYHFYSAARFYFPPLSWTPNDAGILPDLYKDRFPS
jgi:hypothetical protein